MQFSTTTLLVAALATLASAHMKLLTPVALGAEQDGELMLGPLERFEEQAPFPCRGHLDLLSSFPRDSVPTWESGSTQSFTLGGTTPHYGGSCQASLSYDSGATWKVIHSYPGTCPHRNAGDEQTFEFTVPEQALGGEALFSWSWFNREQEMYHNCAVVNIAAGNGGSGNVTAEGGQGYGGLDAFPDMLVADVSASNCMTPLSDAETLFPDMGEDESRITYPEGYKTGGQMEYPLNPPTCG
ncbi:hypothetical protein EDC01DRAFT_644106 [Geopyxis carbonaria]|nr:hypothetical protein EDC01DRAFT_644106 [Geopyxis carbonaria]